MRAGVQARGTKQQARINRFEDLKENLYQVNQEDDLELNLATQRLGKKVLEIKDGSYRINDQTLLEHLDLLIQSRERLGITGKNGAGKSTLLNILAGRIPWIAVQCLSVKRFILRIIHKKMKKWHQING